MTSPRHELVEGLVADVIIQIRVEPIVLAKTAQAGRSAMPVFRPS